jgi:hypothetical protein
VRVAVGDLRLLLSSLRRKGVGGDGASLFQQKASEGFRRLQKEEGRRKKEDGRWKMEDGRWKMEDGRWKMEEGRRKMEDGSRKMEDGRWKMEGAIKSRVSTVKNVLTVRAVAIEG